MMCMRLYLPSNCESLDPIHMYLLYGLYVYLDGILIVACLMFALVVGMLKFKELVEASIVVLRCRRASKHACPLSVPTDLLLVYLLRRHCLVHQSIQIRSLLIVETNALRHW
ncbi:uncharacterized protein LOC131221501 isoform X1 [Magnolia sinica]|uniref:uncharacterized protein LOC131221501 isoform X1 n=1 Tax=Magnolia sinica TaxID=86752 RepID=UPI00265890E2|nr:uncharacterized protein LOC131221501 isoform X1 [Magnolia sinica]